ncbi:mandelate racemase/muconate lactonizing enzyme family protein [Litorivicinus sp.]|nr:mandelate racemase/muconate lactonizing enzyme family protein [Litorivicinus sp.]MDC1239780.1 mandelate racemase/muconate lactonizing enzyme family protein [Litorivicinus sp.]MDC1466490.1 mandelate racemase/muconate lactonizing enzyme family protein [Litorivicinus sp.]
MKITAIYDSVESIASSIQNAYIDFSKMTCSVVAIETDVIRDGHPVVGFGFNSNGRYAASGILRERFIPRLLEAEPEALLDDEGLIDPHKAWDLMMTNEKPGGHGERSVAVGVLDMALWDAVAKIEQKPLYQLLADRASRIPDERVWVYAAGGYYYPGKNIDALQDEFRGYLDLGYTVCKMKIGAADLAEDCRRIEAALKVVGSGNLCVDANGRFDLSTTIQYANAMAQYDLFWYEEAADPLDFEIQAALAQAYQRPIATGENLFSHQDARNLIRYGGMRSDRDYLQFDCALSYGLVEYYRTLSVLSEEGWSSRRVVPHGGHQMSLHIAAGLGLGGNESYPGVFQPFGGFSDELLLEESYVGLPQAPGLGLENKANFKDMLDRAFGHVIQI